MHAQHSTEFCEKKSFFGLYLFPVNFPGGGHDNHVKLEEKGYQTAPISCLGKFVNSGKLHLKLGPIFADHVMHAVHYLRLVFMKSAENWFVNSAHMGDYRPKIWSSYVTTGASY